eukprot:108285-Pyramimonas_sp.AAC.1
MKCPRCGRCFGRLSKALSVTLITVDYHRFNPAEKRRPARTSSAQPAAPLSYPVQAVLCWKFSCLPALCWADLVLEQ